MLSWLSTIHRGQGFTVDVLHTYIDKSVFADGQAYTALSRVRNLENLHLKELNSSAFKTSSTVTEIMTYAAEKNLLKTIPIETKNIKCSKTKVSTSKHTDQCRQANCSVPIHLSKQENYLQFNCIQTKKIQNTKDTPIDLNMTSPNEINAKMTHLAQEILHLHLFLKPIDIQKVTDLCTVHKPTFQTMLYYQQTPTSIFNQSEDIIETKYVFPNSFLKEYIPVNTPPDGNCLFHAISIALNGGLNLTRHLKLFASFVMLQNRHKFLSIIQTDRAHVRNNSTVEKYFEHILYVARKWTEWGNEYHLLALAIVLQRDIYCYVPFTLTELTPCQRNDPKELQSLFDRHKLSNHLLYRAPTDMRSVNYNTKDPVCIFYDAQNHYTAIKRQLNNNTLFSPYVELLGIY